MANKEMFKSSDNMVLFPSSMSLWHLGFDIMRFFDVSYTCYKNKIYLAYITTTLRATSFYLDYNKVSIIKSGKAHVRKHCLGQLFIIL